MRSPSRALPPAGRGQLLRCIESAWPAPPWIRAGTTTRRGGSGASRYAGLNLADHVGDLPEAVRSNRERLIAELSLPSEPHWLRQTHGHRVLDLDAPDNDAPADGACTSAVSVVCSVLTADCLPVLLCDRAGSRVAALHCGWRGLAAGIIQSGLAQMRRAPADLLAWLGPAIGAGCYEVGEEVRDALLSGDRALDSAFTPSGPGLWLLDLYGIARRILERHGTREIYGGRHCTYHDAGSFFSHRRDGATGRMASLIWISAERGF